MRDFVDRDSRITYQHSVFGPLYDLRPAVAGEQLEPDRTQAACRSAAVTAARDAGDHSLKINPSFRGFAFGWDSEMAAMIAAATGRKPVPAVRIVERLLAQAGLSRRERSELIAGLRSCPPGEAPES